MIRPRTLILSPLLTIGGVSAVLIGAALYLGQQDAYDYDYEPVYDAPVQAYVEPVVEADHGMLTIAEFPRHFGGSFTWDGDRPEDRQVLALDVQELNEAGELIVATGRGTYNAFSRNIDFTFRIEANPMTGAFTMWESNPNVSAGFVTEGRHEATFTNSLDSVTARWIGDNGQMGNLTLHARTNSARVGSLDVDGRGVVAPGRHQLDHGVVLEKRFAGNSNDCVRSNNDLVTVHYSGWNDAGVFDDSWQRGKPASFRPSQVIKGWTLALNQLCVGDYARVWIPAAQAYGSHPGARVSGDLTFDIEVLGIAH